MRSFEDDDAWTDPTVPSEAVARPVPTTSPPDRTADVIPGRITGIDLARCLAIFGMFAVHVGPTDADGPLGALYRLPHGRASLLFVLVAGVGVSLLAASSRTSPMEVRGKLLWRAALLLPLGLALQELDHGAAVILQDYSVLFLVAVVLLLLSDRWLLGVAAVALPLGSVGFLWGRLEDPDRFARESAALSDAGADIVHRLVLSGPYPLITWLAPFVLGMWLGRRDLRARSTRRRLLVWGTTVAVGAFGLSQFLREVFGVTGEPTGWDHLVVHTPHSQMPLWVIGSTASAAAILGAALSLAEAYPRATRPLVLAGQLALTVYVGHLVVLHLAPAALTAEEVVPAITLLGSFALASVVIATIWRGVFPQGPLEAVLHLPWRRR